MKKKIIILVSILVIALAIGGLVYASVTLNKKTEEMENHLIEISFTELQKKIDNKETFILVYTQESCSHCMMYKPTLKEEFFFLINISYFSGAFNTTFLIKLYKSSNLRS
mgnify:CR=1 FL=1